MITEVWSLRRAEILGEHHRKGQNDEKPNLSEHPSSGEARLIQDMMGEIQSHGLSKVRAIVPILYSFMADQEATAKTVKELLKYDQFACNVAPDEREKKGYQQWLAPVLIKAIVLVFYSGDGWQGLAQSALTHQYFKPMGVNPLLIVATMICQSQ
ncbi:uncharacterized protein ASPGLDRAFT_38692 [Aspergillus glaucus CBS 516.65]|uniref:DUF6532 domain-containing protein n=1 Tax=Aspergillus glaucus CBS 516.65 TaxID=1160497 RepID=A0A1L9V9Q6_ASPGL|nr:hypothetical protein ASPGLDRAFT_38692 [Aspergillus glaucus CBS 516.65]OJJ80686.1 hypothetical protein ASPGLDRAFT_38692 [Aspergillus glaucus CBS 516.65]